MTLISIILLFVSKKIIKKYVKVRDDGSCYDAEDFWLVGTISSWVIFGIVVVVSICIIGAEIYDIITCVTFPEMMLIEKIQGLISQT